MPVVDSKWNHKQRNRYLTRKAYVVRNDTNKRRKRYQNIDERDTDVFLMCS
jgi:hypothetical protein